MRILVVTTEPLPLPESATTGAGLRAWGLAQGLIGRGLDVAIATSGQQCFQDTNVPHSIPRLRIIPFSRPHGLAEVVTADRPDVVVLQHWGLAAELPELTCPLAIDLAGPHLLERLYWGDPDPERSLLEKLAALRRTDFVTCSGDFQRHYFFPYLAQAGWDLRIRDLAPVIPFGVPPVEKSDAQGSACSDHPEPTFVYGGAFLAWQDPTRPIDWLLDELDRAGRGRLLFFGGGHPVIDASGGRFASLVEVLARHPRVEMRPFRPFNQLLDEYRNIGTVALDLMARNPERELAYTTRTVVYLLCGLPVIYNNYSELSSVIERHQAGWTLDPEDEDGFRNTVRSILEGSAPLDRMRGGALAAAAEHDWNGTIAPLADFCAAPFLREGKTASVLAHEVQARELREVRDERDAAVSALLTLQGKLLYRLQRRLPSLAAPLAPLAWLASLPIALYLYLRLRPTATTQRRRAGEEG